MEFEMNRKRKGSRVLFFATKNGKRFNNINYARKYDAKNIVKNYIEFYGVDKLEKMFNK